MRKKCVIVILSISLVALFVGVSVASLVESSSFSSPAAASNFMSFGEMEHKFDVVSHLESISKPDGAEALYRTARCTSSCTAKCTMKCGGAPNSTGCTHTCTSKCSSSSYCNSAESW